MAQGGITTFAGESPLKKFAFKTKAVKYLDQMRGELCRACARNT